MAIQSFQPYKAILLGLNNLLGNKWFDFNIPFQSVYIIIFFSACYFMKYLRSIVFEFYHVLT
jgi:hypothetical protein